MRDPSPAPRDPTPRAEVLWDAICSAEEPCAAPLLRLRRLLRDEGIGGRDALVIMGALSRAATPGSNVLTLPREEIALALRLLRRKTALTDEGRELLVFHLESSDPVLYPLAALTIGSHLQRDPELARRLGSSTDPGAGPPVLDGTRPLRRRLLVEAARDPHRPLPDLADSAFIPSGRRDLACLLLASAERTGRGVPPSTSRILGLLEQAIELLRRTPDRILALRAGELLAVAERHGLEVGIPTSRIVRALHPDPDPTCPDPALLDAEEARPEPSTGAGLLRLRCLDEVARTRVEQELDDPDLSPPPDTGSSPNPPATAFFRQRMRAWRSVLDTPSPSGSRDSSWGEDLRAELLEALRILDGPATWFSRPTRTRALALFSLLEGSLHARTPPRLRSELASASALGPPGDGDEAAVDFRAGVVARVVALEPSLVQHLDPGLVHGLPTPLLLRIAGNPAARRQAAEFADAVEHRLRVKVMGRGGAEAVRPFLLALAAARPPAALLQSLVLGLGQRPPLDSAGQALTIDDLLEELARGELSGLDLPESADPASRAVQGLRAAGELMDRLGTGSGAGTSEEMGQLASRLERLHEEIGHPPADGTRTLAQSVREAESHWARLEQRVRDALPPTDAKRIRTDVQAALEHLEEQAGLLVAVASAADRDGAIEALAAAESAPTAPLELALDRWVGPASPGSADPSPRRLGWAAGPAAARLDGELRDRWMEGLFQRWARAADRALETGDPDGIAGYLGDPALAPLTGRPEARSRLVAGRGWFLDAHRPGAALAVARQEQAARGQPGATAAIALVGHFIARHAALWLALLIGAILWLDFGDAFGAMAEVGDLRGILWTCAVGLGGAWIWVLADLRRRVAPASPTEAPVRLAGDLLRATAFTAVTAAFTVLTTSGLWLLLSRTDQVLHGPEAIPFVAAWTGFALFVGVFFGLLSKGGP